MFSFIVGMFCVAMVVSTVAFCLDKRANKKEEEPLKNPVLKDPVYIGMAGLSKQIEEDLYAPLTSTHVAPVWTTYTVTTPKKDKKNKKKPSKKKKKKSKKSK